MPVRHTESASEYNNIRNSIRRPRPKAANPNSTHILPYPTLPYPTPDPPTSPGLPACCTHTYSPSPCPCPGLPSPPLPPPLDAFLQGAACLFIHLALLHLLAPPSLVPSPPYRRVGDRFCESAPGGRILIADSSFLGSVLFTRASRFSRVSGFSSSGSGSRLSGSICGGEGGHPRFSH